MGRQLRNEAPDEAAHAACAKCGDVKPPEAFYYSHGRRNAWCKPCYKAWHQERYRSVPHASTNCEVCGTEFQKTASTSRYCSESCFVEGRKRRVKARRLAATPKPHRFCPHCGHRLAPSKRADAVYCTARCEEAAHNATRKAKWKTGEPAEYVSRAYIIERDKRRCHLCGKRCREDEITLDHLIPLAAGGTHTAENLRVACLRCNTSKGARARGEQLLLIG